MNTRFTRRRFLARTAAAGLGAATVALAPRLPGATSDRAGTKRPLFDGKTLTGWRAVPRLPVPRDARFENIPPEELKAAVIQAKGYDAAAVARRLGRAGHIAFEVHDVDPKGPLGMDRWGPGAVCRWRDISITEL